VQQGVELGPNIGSWPNGIKLGSDLLVYPLLTQCLPGFDHQWEALGAPLLDPRLHPMGTDGVHDQRPEWHASMWRPEPPQRIEDADPLHVDAVQDGGVPHDHADQVVDDGKDGQFLQHAWYGFTMQHMCRVPAQWEPQVDFCPFSVSICKCSDLYKQWVLHS
jgi:hypothetical protein